MEDNRTVSVIYGKEKIRTTTESKSVPVFIVVRYMILAVYILLMIVLIFHHENWRDEAQAYLMVKQLNLSEVFQMLSYEGHPCLWYLLIFPFVKAGLPYAALNYISLAVVAVAAWYLLFRSPFSGVMKVLLLASPVYIYYYSVFARSYCLIVLFTVLIAAYYKDRHLKPWLYCTLIALLLQVHILTAGFCFLLALAFLIESIVHYEGNKNRSRFRTKLAALCLPLASAIFYLFEFRNIGFAYAQNNTKVFSASGFYHTLKDSLKALFGDSKLILLMVIISGVLLLVVLMMRRKKNLVEILIFGGSVCFINAVIAFKYALFLRFVLVDAVFFIWLIWVTYSDTGEKIDTGGRKTGAVRNFILPAVFCAVIVFCMIIHLYPDVYRDYNEKYSNAKQCASFIETGLNPSVPVVISKSDPQNAVAAYLTDREVYNPYTDNMNSFALRDSRSTHTLTTEEFLQRLKEKYGHEGGVYVIFSDSGGDYGIIGLKEYLEQETLVYQTVDDNQIEPSESFSVYYLAI